MSVSASARHTGVSGWTRRTWFQVLGALLVAAMIGLGLGLLALPPTLAMEVPWLLAVLNTFFLGLIPLGLAYFATRSHAVTGAPAFLLVGAGFVVFGAGSLLAGWVMPLVGGPNPTVTVHNVASLLASAAQLSAGGLFLMELTGWPRAGLRLPRPALLYTGLLAAMLATAWLAVNGRMPVFFDAAQGPSLLRQIVLAGACLAFALAGFVFLEIYAAARTQFAFWYGLALALTAIGLGGVWLQHSAGDALSWAGRGAQYLGSLYLLIAFWQGRRDLLTAPAGQTAGMLWPYLEQRLQQRTAALRDQLAEQERLTADLRESEAAYRGLFSQTPVVQLLLDAAGHAIVDANQAAADFYGFPLERLRALAFADLCGRPSAEVPPLQGPAGEAVQVLPQRLASGELRQVELSAGPVRLRGRDLVHLMVHDITDRRRAEQRLADSEAALRALLDGNPFIAALVDAAGRVLAINAPGARALGGTVAALVGQPIFAGLPEAAAERWQARLAEALRSGELVRFVDEQAGRALDMYAQPIQDTAGAFTRVALLAVDITEQRRAAGALQESEARFRRLAENAPDLIYRYEFAPVRGFTYVSPAAAAITGYTPEDHYADPDLGYKLVHPADRSVLAAASTDASTAGQPIVLRWIRKDGATIWTEQRNVYLFDEAGQLAAIEGIARDITAAKQNEEALRASEAKFRAVVENSHDGIVFASAAGQLLYVSPAYDRIIGYTAEERAGRSGYELIHPDDVAAMQETFRAIIQAAPGTRLSVEARVRHKDGTWRWVESQGTNMLADPHVQAIVFHGRDITERKQAEMHRRQLARAVEQSPVSIVITDAAGAIEYVNPRFTQVTGYTLAETVGQNPRILKGEHTTPEEYQRLWATITAGGVWQGEFHNRKKTGELYWEHASISPVFDGAGVITNFVAVKEDITTRKQDERRQAAIITMSAALRMVATRAEMLTTILGQTQALLEVAEAALVSLDADSGEAVVEAACGLWEPLIGQRLPAGEVIAAGRPALVNALPGETLVSPLIPVADLAAVALAPLVTPAQTFGALAAGSRHPIDPVQLRLLEAIADIAANALQRVSLYEQARQRADQFAALYTAARELTGQPDLGWLVEALAVRALDLIPADGALIVLVEEAGPRLMVRASHGLPVPEGTHFELGEGLIGRVAQTARPLTVNDYHGWDGRARRFDDVQFGSVAGVPMVSGGDLIGVIALANLRPARRTFGQAEVELLTLLASHAASAIHSAQMLEEAQRRADQLTLVYDAGLALNAVLEPAAQLEYLSKITGRALQADIVEFFQIDAVSGAARLELALGYSPAGRQRLTEALAQTPGGLSLLREVVQSRLPVHIPELAADPRYVAIEPELQSGLWVPVQHQGQLRGVLGILSRRRAAFSINDEQLLLLFANQTAVAIQNAQLFAETERRLSRVQALREVDAAIASHLELRPMLGVVLEQTLAQLGADAGAVLLLEPRRPILEYAASRGFRTQALDRVQRPVGDGLTGEVLQRRRVVALSDLTQTRAGRLTAGVMAEEGFTAYFAAPLIFRGQIKGVLELFHRSPLKPDGEWLDFLETLASQAALAVENVGLLNDLQRSNTELAEAYEATIEGWSRALDLRDKETEGHSQRVTAMALALAEAIGVSPEALVHLRRGALLHDIGKMGVPDSILLKPGPLSDEEWVNMRRHPSLAYEMLSPIAFLRPALDIPYCHHERWDGSGYPRGLQGEQIPLAARIFAVVDVWDALRSDRPYRPAWTPDQVRAHLQSLAGRHFDPRVVEAFLELDAEPPVGDAPAR